MTTLTGRIKKILAYNRNDEIRLEDGSSTHDSVNSDGESSAEHSIQSDENISDENVCDVSIEDHVIDNEGCDNNDERNEQNVEPEDEFDYHEPVYEGAPISFNQ
ncbi:hypothetical protein PV325_011464, partial [Microctonus aethiopoides]